MQNKSSSLFRAIIVLVALVNLGAGTSPTTAMAFQSEGPVRRPRDPQRSLVEQLRPGDKTVEFYINAEIDLATPSRPLTAARELGMAVVDAEQVAVVEIEKAEALLIDRDRWIGTRLKCKVIEAIKVPRGSGVKTGSEVTFIVQGGEMNLSGVHVTAGRKSPYHVGPHYVAFLSSRQTRADDLLTSDIDGPLPVLVDQGRLKGVDGEVSLFDGLTLADVRRAAARGR